MTILVDTNVFGRLSQPDHSFHQTAKHSLETLRNAGHELRVVPQVLYEYWAIATRPAEQNGLGFTIDQAKQQLEHIKRFFLPLRDERGILEPWEELVVRHSVQGKATHDTRLGAAMLRHGLTHLLTFDADDFARFHEIIVIAPDAVVSGTASIEP